MKYDTERIGFSLIQVKVDIQYEIEDEEFHASHNGVTASGDTAAEAVENLLEGWP